jgi:hypothetical protein
VARRSVARTRPSSDLVGPFDVREGVIETPAAVARLIEVGAAGYELLSPAERESVDAALIGLVGALRFPVRWLVQSVPLDLVHELRRLEEAAAAWPGPLGEYAADVRQRLVVWETSRVAVRERALLVWVDRREVPSEDASRRELERRVELVRERLGRVGRGVTAEALGTEGVLLWLYRTWYRDRALSTRAAMRRAASGSLELVVGVE